MPGGTTAKTSLQLVELVHGFASVGDIVHQDLALLRKTVAHPHGVAVEQPAAETRGEGRIFHVPPFDAHGSVRLSLSRYTTEEEIDFVVENMPQVIKTLRAISPFKN